MNTLEWYPWYWKNWRCSEAYALLGAAERGAYRELLDTCWADESFPLDHARLGRLCGTDEAGFRAIWPAISRWFTKNDDGRYFNPQMADIRTAQLAKHQRFIEGGRKGGQSKALARLDKKASLPLAKRERKKDFLSEKGQGGADPEGQSRRLPNCNHASGYWGVVSKRPHWFCGECKE